MNRLASLALLATLTALPLGGCMGHDRLMRVPAEDMQQIQAASKKSVDIVLLSGHAIQDVKILGWTHIGPTLALAVYSEEEGRLLIRADQIQVIIFPNDTAPSDDPMKSPNATQPSTMPKAP